jgi:prepilin-type N-terminal cleavage/methylation domain-containing protein
MTTKPSQSGFSLVEVLVALVLLSFGLLAVAPLFVFATRETAASADYGTAGALAVRRMEMLRTVDFNSLTAGGNLTSNATGFFDTGDSRSTVRWTVTNNATPTTIKTIVVRAISMRQPEGPAKVVELTYRRVK